MVLAHEAIGRGRNRRDGCAERDRSGLMCHEDPAEQASRRRGSRWGSIAASYAPVTSALLTRRSAMRISVESPARIAKDSMKSSQPVLSCACTPAPSAGSTK